MTRTMNTLHVLYDAQCSFCLRCRQWAAAQAAFVDLEFIPYQAPELLAQFEGIEKFHFNDQLLVIADDGGVYQGANALIMLLFALRDYRQWAYRLATPLLMPLSAQCFDLLSSGRKNISKWLSRLADDKLAAVLSSQVPPICMNGIPKKRLASARG